MSVFLGKAARWVAIAAATAIPALAVATTTSCGAGLALSDFTFRGAAADACGGPFTGDPSTLSDFNSALDSVVGIGGGWSLLTTGSAEWNGFGFTFSSEPVIGPSPASGSFWLTVKDLNPGTVPEYPIKFDLLLAPQVAGQWASYLFADEEFALDDTGSGTWFIRFNGNSDSKVTLAGSSRMNFLLRGFMGSECSHDCDPPWENTGPAALALSDAQCQGECATSLLSVPEPGTLMLLGLGAALMAASRRNRR